MYGVKIRDRIQNEEIKIRIGVLSDLLGMVEKCVLRCYGHVKTIDDERVYDSEVEGDREE